MRSEAELETAFKAMLGARDEAILAFADGFIMGFAGRIAAFSIENRIPAVDGWAYFARQGNLMIYGPVVQDVYLRLAGYVDKILKGVKPADLPVELPTKVELFDIANDPEEAENQASTYPDRVKQLLGRLNDYAYDMAPSQYLEEVSAGSRPLFWRANSPKR